jgi:hypothetical protein
MPQPDLDRTEWRVCAQALKGEWLGWHVQVFVRAVSSAELGPGPWRLVRDVEYKVPKGRVRHDYWKGLLKAAAQ